MDDDAASLAAARSSRDRAIVRTVLSGAGVQVTQVGVTLISLPIASRALSPSEFGVYVILTGLAPFLAFSDLGIGFAMTARVAEARAGRDANEVRRSIGTAIVATSVLAVSITTLGVFSALAAPWRDWLSAPDVRETQLHSAVGVAFFGASIAIVGTLGQRMFHAAQQGNVANRWIAAGLVAGGLATVVVGYARPTMIAFVFAASVVPSAVALLSTIIGARRVGGASFAATLRKAEFTTFSELVMPSFWFFLIGVAGAVAYQTDTFVVAHILGADAAGVYGVVARVFGLLPLVVYPAMIQFWPTVVEAYAHGDKGWVASRLKRVMWLAAVGGSATCVVMAVLCRPAIRVWLGDEVVPPNELVVAFAVWTAYTVVMLAPFAVLNGLGRFRLHAIIAVSVATLNLPLTIFLTSVRGIEGAVYGSLISNLVVSIVPAVQVVREVASGGRASPSST